jgi:hypothetical protein
MGELADINPAMLPFRDGLEIDPPDRLVIKGTC